MKPVEAKKRYFSVFIPSMALYLITTFGATWLLKSNEIGQVIKYIIAIIPALFIWWLVWAQIRYFREGDEFERARQVSGALFGIAVLMVFSTGWGFLEMLADAPKFPVFYIFPLFCVAYSIGRYLTRMDGEKC